MEAGLLMDEMKLARECYSASTQYMDSNYRKRWEDAISMFRSKHPQDSKYNKDAYRHRSKIFRPKSRSMVRHTEAAAAAAFFSNADVVSTDAVDQSNEQQRVSAAIHKELLNHRLQTSVPWFQLVIGGIQDASVVGVVCSYQYWKFEQTKEKQEVLDQEGNPILDDEGEPIMVEGSKVVTDEPCVELLPVENVRIDPGADWMNPIKSSPYVIRLIPMYVVDLKSRMEADDPKTGQPKWKKLTDGQIIAASRETDDPTRQSREGPREDSKDNINSAIGDYEIVWVREYFVRDGGKEYVFYTLGEEELLSPAKPLEEVYFHGIRPIVMGCVVIETHKVYPDSPVMLGEQLQRETNEIANQRLDNVKLVLNKRYFAKRGAQVDLRSLVRNVAGSVTMMNDPATDVLPIQYADVTGSSYAEQDRVNADYDELLGNFSQGSVQTNRRMNETVGGMAMISQSANQITEYSLRIFTETWVEPVLRQLVKLEAYYETDETILAIAAERAKLFQRYGVDQVTDSMLKQDLVLKVNVGMGATDPMMKLQRFLMGSQAYAQMAATAPPNFDIMEAGKEIFGLLGYPDGRRFLGDGEEDPRMQAVMQQAQAMVQTAMEQVQKAQADVLKVADEADREAEKNAADRISLEADRDKLRDMELDIREQAQGVDKRTEEIDLGLQKLDMMRDKLKADEEAAVDKLKVMREEIAVGMRELRVAKDEAEAVMSGAEKYSNEIEQKEQMLNGVAQGIASLGDAQNQLIIGINELVSALKKPRKRKSVVKGPSGKTFEHEMTESILGDE